MRTLFAAMIDHVRIYSCGTLWVRFDFNNYCNIDCNHKLYGEIIANLNTIPHRYLKSKYPRKLLAVQAISSKDEQILTATWPPMNKYIHLYD